MTEEMTTSCPLAFYNLVANILFNNELHEEKIAVRNVWAKGREDYLNVYFYATGKTKVLDAKYFHDIYDLSTGRYYKNIKRFIAEFGQVQSERRKQTLETKTEKIEKNYRSLEDIRPEIEVLVFFSLLDPGLEHVKIKVILDYIGQYKLPAELSEQYAEAYVRSLTPGIGDFYRDMEKLAGTPAERLDRLAREAVKISASDGVIHYEEKIYLAELFEILRGYGVEPDVEF